ncbi:hypothetical protein MUN82_03820 [Hymenobacter aerilatus]|uniref:Type II toxin-antitoxin system HicB family antitoxin n=1 Tax=Hymenobacter aerilatus TaxID=2932251 RepID=A0A8T9T2A0_9BACT|nr:hypothetical protein [Hymenobacter aerilatus]UOR06226.1 hypothetical protein MUN82_03820 [Hymenobacter aerilatus]
MAHQSIEHDGEKLTLQIEAFILKEGKHYVAYCPALELSSYGSSPEDAKEAFGEAIEIFLEDTAEKGTLEKLLLSLGWTLRKRPTPEYQPPHFTYQQISNLGSQFGTSTRGPIDTINQRLALSV